MTVHQSISDETRPAYNYAYLDEQTKRMIRRALLKAVAVPGYQVPFGSREMPLARGWGTGGIQVTAAIIGPDDTLKVIDQGADDTTNAVSIRRFFERTADARTTEATDEATIIQTRHRIPEAPLKAGQIMVYQVPQPEPLRKLEPREAETVSVLDDERIDVRDVDAGLDYRRADENLYFAVCDLVHNAVEHFFAHFPVDDAYAYALDKL